MPKELAELPQVAFSDGDIMSGRFPQLLAQAALEHGPIFKWVIDDGRDTGEYLFLVGPEANRFVLHTGRQHFSHDQGWTPVFGETLGRGLLNMDDPQHSRHRKMWNPAFTSTLMEGYLPVILEAITRRTADWPQLGEIDVYAEAREITFDAAASALGGFAPGAQIDELRRLFYILLHGFDGSSETFDEFLERAFSARDRLAAHLLDLIATRRHQLAEQPRDVVGMIVRARDEDGQPLSDEQILGHINILLVAGHETTTTLSAWALHLLATMPAQQALLRAELDTLLGSDARISVEAIRGMRRLDNFLKEVGRLYPPVINVPRGVLSDCEFAGYRIPVGAQVRLALAACHHLPQVFPDPERFDPERFAAPREEDKRTPYGLVTFGGGPRICIGIHFAQIETKALVAHVLRNYQLVPVESQQLKHAGHWTAILEHGIRLRVAPML